MKRLITLIVLSSAVFSAGCSGNSSFEVTGKVQSYNHLGMKCWYIVDTDTGFYYEIITSDTHLLNIGKKVKLKAKSTDRETICQMKDRIEVVSYKVF